MNIYMFNTSIAVLGIFAFFVAELDSTDAKITSF